MTHPDRRLDDLFAEIDRWFADSAAEHVWRWRPPVDEQVLAELTAELAPLHLPDDLVALYRWHDGWIADDQYPVFFFVDADFPSAVDALLRYRLHLDLMADPVNDYPWNPLWFPAFAEQGGQLVELLEQPGRSGMTWDWYYADAPLTSGFDSVESMIRTTFDGWRAGRLPEPVILEPGSVVARRCFEAERNPLAGRPRARRDRISSGWTQQAGPPAGSARSEARTAHRQPRRTA